MVNHVRHFCLALDSIRLRLVPSQALSQTLINLNQPSKGQKTDMVYGMLRESKNSKEKLLNEKCLMWALKLCRLTED